MRPTLGMTRVLILVLLTVRLLAAPISTRRPDSRGPDSKSRFIVRMCKWPAQRLQRATTSSVAVPRKAGSNKGMSTSAFWGSATAWLGGHPVLACTLPQAAWAILDLSARRVVDSPRC
jgi:hypothetical protein